MQKLQVHQIKISIKEIVIANRVNKMLQLIFEILLKKYDFVFISTFNKVETVFVLSYLKGSES